MKNYENQKKITEEMKLREIYNEFAAKIKKIEEERDQKTFAIFKKIELRQVENIRNSIKNIK
jgi:hypothetical protein